MDLALPPADTPWGTWTPVLPHIRLRTHTPEADSSTDAPESTEAREPPAAESSEPAPVDDDSVNPAPADEIHQHLAPADEAPADDNPWANLV